MNRKHMIAIVVLLTACGEQDAEAPPVSSGPAYSHDDCVDICWRVVKEADGCEQADDFRDVASCDHACRLVGQYDAFVEVMQCREESPVIFDVPIWCESPDRANPGFKTYRECVDEIRLY